MHALYMGLNAEISYQNPFVTKNSRHRQSNRKIYAMPTTAAVWSIRWMVLGGKERFLDKL